MDNPVRDNQQLRAVAECADELGTLVSKMVFETLMSHFNHPRVTPTPELVRLNSKMDNIAEALDNKCNMLLGRIEAQRNTIVTNERDLEIANRRILQLEEEVKQLRSIVLDSPQAKPDKSYDEAISQFMDYWS